MPALPPRRGWGRALRTGPSDDLPPRHVNRIPFACRRTTFRRAWRPAVPRALPRINRLSALSRPGGIFGGPLLAGVDILQPDDVVLAQIGTRLHLDEVQGKPARILEPVDAAEGKEHGFVLPQQDLLVV